jgi:hypothetical protein
MTTVTEIIGIYHADGGPVGEAKYVLGKLLGRAHCALCDITHSPLRRKPAWDAMVERIGVPVRVLHRNELPADVARCAARSGTPVVLGRTQEGAIVTLLEPDQLESVHGSVERFEQALQAALRASRSGAPSQG